MTFSDLNEEMRKKGVPEYDELPDRELASLLKQGDNKAWEYVYEKSVLPVFKQSTRNGFGFGTIARDRNIDGYELLSYLYEIMIGKGKIDGFRYETRLVSWMQAVVRSYILTYAKKNPYHLSDDHIKNVSIDRSSAKEAAEILQLSFAELWRQNPMRAYVCLLKLQKFSSDEIRDRLGLSSSNYADQCYTRAKADLQEIAKRYGEER